jgi:hypothetical protein
MIWIKRLGVVLLLAVIGFLVWSWQAGPMRVKRDISGFAEMMQSCTDFSQDFKDPFSGQTMNRAISGLDGDTCGITMQTYSPQSLHCEFAKEDMPELARAFGMRAENIGFFGGMQMSLSTENPDALQQAMNSPACKLIEG